MHENLVKAADKAELEKIVQQQTIEARRVEDLRLEVIKERLAVYPFLRISGICSKGAILAGREKMKARFSTERDAPTTGELASAVMDNFQKMSIGCAKHGGVNRPRFKRVFYNPIWAEDVYGLRETFVQVSRVRNLLAGWPDQFAIRDIENGMWTAARIHQFPRGGGFMVAHRDTVLPGVIRESGLGDFFQPVLVMSRFGEDFFSGGGFVDIADKRYLYEQFCDVGDIVIYDVRTVHGVEDVDPSMPYRQDSLDGRMSGLVTLYKKR